MLFRHGLGIFCFLFGIGGGACAAGAVSECPQTDWERVGYEDGQNGEGAWRLLNYGQICKAAEVVPDAEAWRRGQQRGLAVWCTYANGLQVGRQGKGFDHGLCDPQYQARFLEGMHAGQLERKQMSELQRREQRLIEIRERERAQANRASNEFADVLFEAMGDALFGPPTRQQRMDFLSEEERRRCPVLAAKAGATAATRACQSTGVMLGQ